MPGCPTFRFRQPLGLAPSYEFGLRPQGASTRSVKRAKRRLDFNEAVLESQNAPEQGEGAAPDPTTKEKKGRTVAVDKVGAVPLQLVFDGVCDAASPKHDASVPDEAVGNGDDYDECLAQFDTANSSRSEAEQARRVVELECAYEDAISLHLYVEALEKTQEREEEEFDNGESAVTLTPALRLRPCPRSHCHRHHPRSSKHLANHSSPSPSAFSLARTRAVARHSHLPFHPHLHSHLPPSIPRSPSLSPSRTSRRWRGILRGQRKPERTCKNAYTQELSPPSCQRILHASST